MLLVAPHGGDQVLTDAPIREKTTSRDPRFNASKDLMTAELTWQLWESFPQERKPSLLVGHLHRRYLDLNRPVEYAAESPQGKAAHHSFHLTLKSELDRIVEHHGHAFLLDFHGQKSEPFDLVLGTVQGTTIASQSETILWGNVGLVGALRDQGFKVSPNQPGEAVRLNGGYIVKHYSRPPTIEAWQLEHGPNIRFDTALRALYIEHLASHLLKALTP